MRAKKIKVRCTKVMSSKCTSIVKTYDKVQFAYLAVIESNKDIVSFESNIPLDGLEFSTDFLCMKEDGEYMVRECVYRSKLLLPRTTKLLDESRNYWLRRGISDWGIVVEKEECCES